MNRTHNNMKNGFTFLLVALALAGCGRKGTDQSANPFLNNLPFQVKSSQPTYAETQVNKTTGEILVYFTEPVDISTVSGSYKFTETVGANSTDITSRITGVSPLQGGTGVLFQVSGTLAASADYRLTLYPGIISTVGNYLSYLTRVDFSTGNGNTFGYGELIISGQTPKVEGGLQKDLRCGCLTIYATFSESLVKAPLFYIEAQNMFGILGNLFSGGQGSVSSYPYLTNDNRVWGVFMGCSQDNGALDRKLKVTIRKDQVIDLEGEIMAEDVKDEFSNPWFYSGC